MNLERLTYICLIGLCLLSSGVLVRDRLLSHGSPVSMGPDPADRLLGKTLNVQGVDWQHSKLSVVLFLSSSCHFCEASVPFYTHLAAEHQQGRTGNVQFLAVSAEPERILENHFAQEHITFDHVYQISLPNDLLRGTPTLMIIDNQGTIRRAIVGQLDKSHEDEILRVVRKG